MDRCPSSSSPRSASARSPPAVAKRRARRPCDGSPVFEGGHRCVPPSPRSRHAGSPVGKLGLGRNPPDAGARAGCASRIVVQVGRRPSAPGRDVPVIGAAARGRMNSAFATRRPLNRGRLHHDAQVPSQTPARWAFATQDPGACASASPARPRARHHTTSFFVAEEVREIMAQLGYRKFDEMIGPDSDCSTSRRWWRTGRPGDSTSQSCSCGSRKRREGPKNLSRRGAETIIWRPCSTPPPDRAGRRAPGCSDRGAPGPDRRGDQQHRPQRRAADACREALARNSTAHARAAARHHSSELQGHRGVRAVRAHGWRAGRPPFDLEGEGNDYVGKGLSGGPASSSSRRRNSGHRAGRVDHRRQHCGCTGGDRGPSAISRGIAGERFAVAQFRCGSPVVEGAGDHCLRIHDQAASSVVLGKTGRKLRGRNVPAASPMCWTRGPGDFAKLCNLSMVRARTGAVGRDDQRPATYHHSQRSRGRMAGSTCSRTCSTLDVERLHVLITRQRETDGPPGVPPIFWRTGKAWLPKFRKVMPVEYPPRA